MKKHYNALSLSMSLLLAAPLLAAWIPGLGGRAAFGFPVPYWASLVASFRQVSVTLAATVGLTLVASVALGYASILWWPVGRALSAVLEAVESIPSILVALFCYAPVSIMLAKNPQSTSATLSMMVFVFAAVLTASPEALRSVTLPLGELYHRKYSMSLRAYGFTKARILWILLGSRSMRVALRRSAAAVLLKTLVLDCSFGFIIQIGMGTYGTPAHTSPGALIAANRDAVVSAALSNGRMPAMFWLPVALLAGASLAMIILLGDGKEGER